MPSVSIPDELYHRIALRAAALNVSVEQLIAPLLDEAAEGGPPPCAKSNVSMETWNTTFDSWMAEVQKRAPRYPPGFRLDDSRESFYQGCGE